MVQKYKSVTKAAVTTANKKYKTQRARYTYLAKKGFTQSSIARAYGVTQRTVWQALTNYNPPKEYVK
jgi:DNA invertase Pin-like site-specific DNA recombinase